MTIIIMMVDNDIIINDNINYSNDDEIIILLIITNNCQNSINSRNSIYIYDYIGVHVGVRVGGFQMRV